MRYGGLIGRTCGRKKIIGEDRNRNICDIHNDGPLNDVICTKKLREGRVTGKNGE